MGKILEIIDLSYMNFNRINLSFDDKTYYSIIGPNNCGKTTLFKLISGIIPSNDSIYYRDIPLNLKNKWDYITNFGIVDRVNENSFIYKKIFDEMMYPLRNLGYSESKCLERINDVTGFFDTKDYLDKDIKDLNYYEKELLLIMISLLHKPKILLLDSVLEIFPDNMKEKIVKVLRRLVMNGMTIINFTSFLDSAYDSDKFILLDDYKIIGEYTKHDIYKDDKFFYEHNLEIPFMIDLSIKLKMYSLVDKEYSSMKAMVDDLWP